MCLIYVEIILLRLYLQKKEEMNKKNAVNCCISNEIIYLCDNGW